MGRIRRVRDGENGATTLEFVIVSLVLFFVVFTGASLAIIEVGGSTGSNAAREGARVGILNYVCADSYPGNAYAGHDSCASPSPQYQLIQTAALKQLGGLVQTSSVHVAVSCYAVATQTGTTPALESCTSGVVTTGQDLIEVDVTYTSDSTSPFVANTTHTQTARMTMIGLPNLGATTTTLATTTTSTTSTTLGCTFVSGNASPNPVSVNGSGKLSSNITVTVTTSGNCSSLVASVDPGGGVNETATLAGGPTSWTGVVDGSAKVWTSGTRTITITASGSNIGTVSMTVS